MTRRIERAREKQATCIYFQAVFDFCRNYDKIIQRTGVPITEFNRAMRQNQRKLVREMFRYASAMGWTKPTRHRCRRCTRWGRRKDCQFCLGKIWINDTKPKRKGVRKHDRKTNRSD